MAPISFVSSCVEIKVDFWMIHFGEPRPHRHHPYYTVLSYCMMHFGSIQSNQAIIINTAWQPATRNNYIRYPGNHKSQKSMYWQHLAKSEHFSVFSLVQSLSKPSTGTILSYWPPFSVQSNCSKAFVTCHTKVCLFILNSSQERSWIFPRDFPLVVTILSHDIRTSSSLVVQG